MAALVQTISQPTVSMLQTRPASSSGAFSNNQRGGNSRGGNYLQYRPNASTAPYALNQIPGNNQNPLRQHPPSSSRFDSRSMSAPTVPDASISNISASPSKSIDHSDKYTKSDPNRLSLLSTSLDLSLIDPRLANSTKSNSDQNTRTHKRSETSSGAFATQNFNKSSNINSTGKLYSLPSQSLSSPGNLSLAKDNTIVSKGLETPTHNLRRSTVTIGGESNVDNSQTKPETTAALPARTWASIVSTPYTPVKPVMPAARTGLRPSSSSGRQDSDESLSSVSSINKEHNTNSAVLGQTISSNQPKVINIPPRSSSDITKRLNNPSPLSNPAAINQDQSVTQSSFAKLVSDKFDDMEQPVPTKPVIESPAQQHLASISKKDGKKDGKPSRLRRAFSFGSAAELRKASAETSHAATSAAAAAPRKLQKSQYETEEEAREAAIVQRQEASGLGNSIYSGQGNVFSGSTDNLSVSSTASSASIMLRKMGKGMKKGTRSLVGLFRPKSIVGVPASDAAVPEPSMAQVSMVTVEAEREKVNVNLHPSDQVGGGTGFPKLERNSIETGSEPSLTISDRSGDGVKSRRSIVGSDNDRAEILAAVKKGILKRNGTDSGSASPVIKSPAGHSAQLPPVPRFDMTPRSSAPGTPDDNTPRGHRRTDSVTIEGEDYFISMGRFTGSDSKSLPGTPRSAARNITFSPRIQFHDTWTALDYDRRGEIATCNRLTPSLAQAIKEELNTFKMEMEVHESSKVYTHFF